MSEILDIFGVDWRLLLVQGFNFGVLLVILWYILYRPVMTLLEKRQAMITEGVRNAQRATEELAEVGVQKEAILTDASREAGIILERAKERALSKEETILKEAQERSERMVKEAAQRAEEEKRRAVSAATEELARLTVLGAEKVLRSHSK